MSEQIAGPVINQETSGRYMPQLDTLRAIAVFLVLLEHWLPEEYWLRVFPYGMAGVTLFFVLSGFLITQILIKSRIISEQKDQSRFHSLRQFYARRTLRIFPIYYITIFILYIFNTQHIREKILWFIFYASNIYFYKINNWDGNLSHLWTLAVEEQFYIIWPFVILFIPKKYLFKAITGIVLFGPAFRSVFFYFSDHTEWASNFIHILTPSCMDCFGLGAVLAYMRIYKGGAFQLKPSYALSILFINLISIAVLLFFEENVISVFLFRLNVSVIFMLLISKVSIGFTGFLKIIFENKILMYLGKISYGLYLFHNFIPMIYAGFKLPPVQNVFFRLTVQAVLLIFLASASWFIIEKPLNNLKKYFKYN